MRESKPLVLVADDEPPMNDLVVEHLRALPRQKVDIVQAHDGAEAWRLAKEHLPDLVVLDVMMPEMSGWEVCRKIREDVALAHTGVVMLTGIGETLNSLTSPLYGADAYLDKPFSPDALHRAVKQVLDARAAQRNAAPRPSTHGLLQEALDEDRRARANGVSKPSKAAPAGKKSAKKAPAAKKAAAKAPVVKKATAKKATTKKAPVAKKAAVKKAPAKKVPVAKKKAPAAKKVAAKKVPAKKAPIAKKAAVKKAPIAKKAAVKKAPVAKKKAPAKRR